MSKWYAVKVGRTPGIYSSWPLCQAQTSGYSGAVFKSFPSRDDALSYLYDGKIPDHEKSKDGILLAALPSVSDQSKSETNPSGMAVPVSAGGDETMAVRTAKGIELPSSRSAPKYRMLPIVTGPQDQVDTEPFSYGPFEPPRVEGKNFMALDRSLLDTGPELLVIYIDGSKRPTVNHRGSGAYCRFNKKDYSLSVPFTSEVARKYQILESDLAALSSPTMEYLALGEVLWRFVQIRLPEISGRAQILNPRLRLIFVGDYLGVKCFTEGSWKPKEDYIKKIQGFCGAIIKFLEERGIDVQIRHCNGHVGILGNELSDVLAKSQIACDDFQTLVKDLSESFKHRF
jgi:ribonuclease HI